MEGSWKAHGRLMRPPRVLHWDESIHSSNEGRKRWGDGEEKNEGHGEEKVEGEGERGRERERERRIDGSPLRIRGWTGDAGEYVLRWCTRERRVMWWGGSRD
jgi:hypothetical protein